MGWGAVAGAVGSIAGGLLGGGGLDPHEQYKKAQKVYKYGLGLATLAGLQGEQAAKKQKKLIQSGYANAKTALSQSGYSAGQQVKQAAAKAGSTLSQGLTNAGLSGTTVMSNMQAGIGYQTAAQLAEIDASVGQLLANLGIEEAGALASAEGNIANAAINTFNLKNTQLDKWAGAYMGTMAQAGVGGPTYDFGELGSWLMSAANKEKTLQSVTDKAVDNTLNSIGYGGWSL